MNLFKALLGWGDTSLEGVTCACVLYKEVWQKLENRNKLGTKSTEQGKVYTQWTIKITMVPSCKSGAPYSPTYNNYAMHNSMQL